jgi:DNA-binding MarR family transcriptional regulator
MSTQEQSDAYQIVWLIRRLFRSLAHKSNENLQVHGISVADRAVMEFLYPNERLSVPEIAERYQVSRQHVQVTVNALLQTNLLDSEKNPRHKRSPLITLTREGRSLFAQILSGDRAFVEQLISTIADKDVRATRRTLETLLDQIT